MLQLTADGQVAASVLEGAGGGDDDGAAEAARALQPPIEGARARRERWRSVYIIYFTMFQMSLGFSIVLTGVWPYLDKASVCHCTTQQIGRVVVVESPEAHCYQRKMSAV